MGSGASTKKSDVDTNEDSVLIEETDNSFSVINLHIAVKSSVKLLMLVLCMACMICLVIRLRLCAGICHEACCYCCAQYLERPRPEAIEVKMSCLPVLGPAESGKTRVQCLEG